MIITRPLSIRTSIACAQATAWQKKKRKEKAPKGRVNQTVLRVAPETHSASCSYYDVPLGKRLDRPRKAQGMPIPPSGKRDMYKASRDEPPCSRLRGSSKRYRRSVGAQSRLGSPGYRHWQRICNPSLCLSRRAITDERHLLGNSLARKE
jgi:hypothetical protein